MAKTREKLSRLPRILFIDIETLPNVSWTWGKYEQNVLGFKQEACVATVAAKWLGEPVFAYGLPDYKGYRAESYDDKKLIEAAWKLLDECDIAVAHNGDQFDFKVLNARFIYHQLPPPSPYKTIDTKKVAKRAARFNSNKLDDLGTTMGVGRKIKTDFELWKGCMAGDRKQWARMVRYNKQDVVLLEKVYLRLRPWAFNHPNVGMYSQATCPKCGSHDVHYRGEYVTTSKRYRKFQCQGCGGWGRDAGSHFANVL